MQPDHRNILIPAVAVFALFLLVPATVATDTVTGIVAESNVTPSRMGVGIYVNAIDALDPIAGTYSLDFYLHFVWTDPAIQTASFELMNGHIAAGQGSLQKEQSGTSGQMKEEWYRVSADFRNLPNLSNYPFQTDTLPIEIEDSIYTSSQLIYVPLTPESGIDPAVTVPGWEIGTPTFSVSDHDYPWNETHSHLAFSVPITKYPTDSLFQTLIPPLIFCFIAALSFFIQVRESELVHLRYVLVTSMFISAVMYQFTEVGFLPGLSMLKLFDKFMIAVYVFLALTIVTTTVCYLAHWQWEKPERVRPINRIGFVISLLLPILVFWLLVILV